MADRVLFEGNFLSLVLRDGWYEFMRGVKSRGVVYILPFRRNEELAILGRFEVCPAHGDERPTLTSITGMIPLDQEPIECAVQEMHEEAGYHVTPDRLIDLGVVNLTKGQDTLGYLYAIDVTYLVRGEAPGDGTRGEEGSYCGWVNRADAIVCKDPVMGSMIVRLQQLQPNDLG